MPVPKSATRSSATTDRHAHDRASTQARRRSVGATSSPTPGTWTGDCDGAAGRSTRAETQASAAIVNSARPDTLQLNEEDRSHEDTKDAGHVGRRRDGCSGLAACGGGTTSSSTSASSGPVTLTFWHNSTTGDGKAYWEATAADYMKANPNVTIKIQAIQNEEMDGKLQTALNSATPGHLHVAWRRQAGRRRHGRQVMDLTSVITPETKKAVGDGALQAFTVDGKLYGMPTSVLPVASSTARPVAQAVSPTRPRPWTTCPLLSPSSRRRHLADRPRRQGRLAAAHWYYFFALRECTQDTMNKAAKDAASRLVLDEGRPGPEGLRAPTRSTTATSPPQPSRVQAPRPACWPTTRRRWSSWVPGPGRHRLPHT